MRRRSKSWVHASTRATVVVTVVAALAAASTACGRWPRSVEPTAPVAGVDHWHVAFGVWVCDRYLDAFVDRHGARHGIHTHGDGLIHIHPADRSTAAGNATLAAFDAEVDLQLSTGSLRLPDQVVHRDGAQCPNGPGRLSILRWAPTPAGDATPETLGTDPGAVALRDRDALAIVFAPAGTHVPPPPSVDTMDALSDVVPTMQPDRWAAGATHGPYSVMPSEPGPPTTTVARVVPTGRRDSFAVWLVGQGTAEGAGGCPTPQVEAWQSGICYSPLPSSPRLGADIIAHSKAVRTKNLDLWSVQLVLTPDGLERFNELAGQAWRERRPLAIELGGRVITTPSLQIERFTSDDVISISAGLDEQATRSVAMTLDGR